MQMMIYTIISYTLPSDAFDLLINVAQADLRGLFQLMSAGWSWVVKPPGSYMYNADIIRLLRIVIVRWHLYHPTQANGD